MSSKTALELLINSQIHKFIYFRLKAEVESLRAALKEKDEHCGRLAAILKTQAAEWKRIKDKLANGRRKGDESVSAAGSAGEYCETKEQDTQQAQTEDNNEPESQDDMTQLPTHSHSHNHNQSHNQSIQSTQSPPTEPDSQSHLDLLISLVSSDSSEDETDENKQISRDLEYFQGPKKRKSHSRGCPCCDKVIN